MANNGKIERKSAKLIISKAEIYLLFLIYQVDSKILL